jgi:ABC-2 type transport system permease protein
VTSAIHDRRYRPLEPRGARRRFRALPIARETLRQVLARRALLLLLALSFIPFVLAAGGLVLVSRLPEMARALPPIAEIYARYLGFQLLFAVLLTVWAGAGVVADDLRTGALLIYLSRPLTRLDYILGRLSVLIGLGVGVMAAPPLGLWMLGAALDPEGTGVRGPLFIPVAILAQSVLVAAVLSVLTLGASAVARNGALAGLLVVGLLVVGDAAAALAPQSARSLVRLLSVRSDLAAVSGFVFGVAPDPASLPWAAALLGLLVVGAAACAVLLWRVRAVDIVS